jgi:rhomboid protease GluP
MRGLRHQLSGSSHRGHTGSGLRGLYHSDLDQGQRSRHLRGRIVLLKSIAKYLNREDWIIPAILYANVGMFVLSLLLHPQKIGFSLNPLTFLSPETRSLMLLGATGTIPIHRFGRWWTLISANYLHGSILHIFFNMMAFRQIAPLIRTQFGGSRMIIIYTLSGMAGFWTSYLAGVPLTIGASAALCGLMGAALYYGKSRGGVFGRTVFRQIGNWAVGIAIFGLLVPGIDNWGHGGGMVSGAVCGALLGYRERSDQNALHHLAAGILVLVTAAILLWAVFSRFVTAYGFKGLGFII